MRAYDVRIEAVTADGETVRFIEFVVYPNRPADASGAVSEAERESVAVDQVWDRHPDYRSVEAKGSLASEPGSTVSRRFANEWC